MKQRATCKQINTFKKDFVEKENRYYRKKNFNNKI